MQVQVQVLVLVLVQHHNDAPLEFAGSLQPTGLIGDKVVPSDHPRTMSARERPIDPALQGKMLASLRQACDSNDVEAMLRQVRKLVPEYRPADEVNAEVANALAGRYGADAEVANAAS